MTPAQALARHRYLTQVVIVICSSAAFVLLTDALGFRSFANVVWMIGIPFIIAMAVNVSWDRRCFMAMALIGVSLVTTMVVGVNFTSYA